MKNTPYNNTRIFRYFHYLSVSDGDSCGIFRMQVVGAKTRSECYECKNVVNSEITACVSSFKCDSSPHFCDSEREYWTLAGGDWFEDISASMPYRITYDKKKLIDKSQIPLRQLVRSWS